jgi:hypothetical protein
LVELSKIDKSYQKVLSKIDKFREYEAILGIEKPFKFDEQKRFFEAYDLRFNLWSNWSQFKKDRKRWFYEPFRNGQQDVNKTVESIEKYV